MTRKALTKKRNKSNSNKSPMSTAQRAASGGIRTSIMHIPQKGDLATPKYLQMFELHFFEHVKHTSFKIKNGLLLATRNYMASFNGECSNQEIDLLASSLIKTLNSIPHLKANGHKERIYRTGIKIGSELFSLSKYVYLPRHIKGLTLEYQTIVLEDVLTGELIHTYGVWVLHTSEDMSDEEADHYENQLLGLSVESTVPLDIMTDIIFALTPFKRAA